MAKLLKLRRGTTAQHSSFTGAEGEVTVDTDKESLVVHNGSNAGGYPIAREDMSNVSSASIAGRLANDSIATTKIAAGALPSDVTIASANFTSGQIVNSHVNASAAIAGTKIAPDFGSQNVTTTGSVSGDEVNIAATTPVINFNDSNHNPDYQLSVNAGVFSIKDATAAADRITVTSTATTVTTNLDASAGVDVTGNITVSGTVDGRDVAADGTKLDGIESGATADQSAAEILTAIKTVDSTGSGLDADLLDGKHDTSFLRSDAGGGAASYNATSAITFSAGAGAATIAANSDIRLPSGNWTGDTTDPKIQGHGNYLYICGGSSGFVFRENTTNRWFIDGSGHYIPGTDSTYDIGDNSTRVRNIYADTLYGDGSNLTGVQPFPTGTKMLFQQTAAPTGWTKVTSAVDNKALRLVSGTVGSGGNSAFTTAFASYTPSGNVSVGTSGNSTASFSGNATTSDSSASFSANATTGNSTASFSGSISSNTGNAGASTSSVSTSGTVNNHTLSVAQMPSHSHSFTRRTPGSYASYGGTATNWDANSASNGNTHNTGGGGSHSHGFSGSSHSHNVNNHYHSFSGNVSGNTGNHTHSVSVSGNTGDHTHTVSVSGNTGNHTHSGGSGSFSGSARDFAVQYIDVIIASKD